MAVFIGDDQKTAILVCQTCNQSVHGENGIMQCRRVKNYMTLESARIWECEMCFIKSVKRLATVASISEWHTEKIDPMRYFHFIEICSFRREQLLEVTPNATKEDWKKLTEFEKETQNGRRTPSRTGKRAGEDAEEGGVLFPRRKAGGRNHKCEEGQ